MGARKVTKVKYPREVKEQALARMMAPRNEPVTKVSRELKVRAWTLYAWRKEALPTRAAPRVLARDQSQHD